MKTIVLLLLFFVNMYSQQKFSDPIENYYHSKKIENAWLYITANDTLKGIIIEHTPAQFFCGISATASVTIIKLKGGELSRVLDLCNLSTINRGQIVDVIPMLKPTFNISLPWTSVSFDENSDGKYLIESKYNEQILNTYWGHIISK